MAIFTAMKSYFVRLFNYDKAATLQMLCATIAAGNPPEAVLMLSHLLAAQQVWLPRCKKQPQTVTELWPDWKAEELTAIIDQNHKNWIAFLDNLNEAGFAETFYYENSRKQGFSNRLEDVLAHVINHGTHHRAQAGQYLKQAGDNKLPASDYIFYVRENKS